MPYPIYILIFITIIIVLSLANSSKKEGFLAGAGSSGSGGGDDIALKDVGIYLINLDRNADRLESFIAQFIMSDLRYKQFQRITAVDGRDIENIQDIVSDVAYQEIMQIEKTGYRTKHYQLTRGAIGCFMSHMKAFELISMGDDDYGLVFEDDVIIDTHILKRLNKLMSSIPNDYDVLLLGCQCIQCDKYDVYFDAHKFFLTHCYIIKKASAARLYMLLKKDKIKQQIDSELSDMATSGSIKIYCLREKLASQTGTFQTTIQTPLKVMPGIDPYVTLL